MINLYIDTNSVTKMLNSDASRVIEPPVFQVESYQTYACHFVTVSGTTLTPVDVTDCLSWTFAIDKDFSHSTSPMTDTIVVDDTDADTGVILFTVDCDTASFENALGSNEKLTTTRFQIRGYDNATPASGRPIRSHILTCICYNAITLTTPTT